MRTGRRRERGVAFALMAIWLAVSLGMAAMAVEVARLTTTATEVQIAADAAALGAAMALGKGQSTSDVQTAGKTVAAANFADGQPVDTNGVQIDIGHYNPDPTVNPHFSSTCAAGGSADGCNAARATVTLPGIKYIVASILNGQAGTHMTRTAVAAAECQGSGFAGVPLVVCQQALQRIDQDEACGPVAGQFQMNPNTAQNSCWTSLNSLWPANAQLFLDLLPPQCGGTKQFEVWLQDPIPLQNGVDAKVWKALQCCVACQDFHDYTPPVVDCSAMGNCNTSPPVLSFATIHIQNPTDIDPPGGGNTNCSSFSWGCSRTINNTGVTGITASQICKSDLAGKPGGPRNGDCTNRGSTVVVLGQLP